VDTTLRNALWGFLRPLVQLLTNLLSPEVGAEWEVEFKKFLRKEPCWVSQEVVPSGAVEPPKTFIKRRDFREYRLYLHDKQERQVPIGGFELKSYLEESGILRRALSIESKLVVGWKANPETYPKELRSKHPVLWGSLKANLVPYLVWHDGEIKTEYQALREEFMHGRMFPAILKVE